MAEITFANTGMSSAAFTAALNAAAGIAGTTRQTLTILDGVLVVPVMTGHPLYSAELSAPCRVEILYPDGADPSSEVYGADVEFVAPATGGPYRVAMPTGSARGSATTTNVELSAGDPPAVLTMQSWINGSVVWWAQQLRETPFVMPEVVTVETIEATFGVNALIFDSLDPTSGKVFTDAAGGTASDLGANNVVGRWAPRSSNDIALVAATGAELRLVQTSETAIYLGIANHTDGDPRALTLTLAGGFGADCTICRATIGGPAYQTGVAITADTPVEITQQDGINSRIVIVNSPLTAEQQSIMDAYLSGGVPLLGNNRIVNGDFSADPIDLGWSQYNQTADDWQIASGYAYAPDTGVSNAQRIKQLTPLQENTPYLVTLDHIHAEMNLDVYLNDAIVKYLDPDGVTGTPARKTFSASAPSSLTPALVFQVRRGAEYLSRISVVEIV